MDFQSKLRNFLQGASQAIKPVINQVQTAAAPVERNIATFGGNLIHQAAQTPLLNLLPNTQGLARVAPQPNLTVGNTLAPFIQNRVINPALQGISNAPALLKYANPIYGNLNPNADPIKAATGIGQTIGNVVAPAWTVGLAGADALKGAALAQRTGGNVQQGALQGLTGAKTTGLGSALTSNPFLAGALNTGEFVGPLAHGKLNDLKQAIPALRVKSVKHAVDRILAHEPEIVSVLKRFDTTLGDARPNVHQPMLDINLATDANHVWHQVFGGNKKPPRDLSQTIGEIREAFAGARTERQMKIGGIKLGFVDDGRLEAGRPIEAPTNPLPIKPNNRVGLLDLGLNRARNVIEKQGASGKKLAGLLQSSRDLAERTAGEWISKLPTVRKLSPAEFENFVDAAEAKAAPMSAKVQQAFSEWSALRDQVLSQARGAGLDVGKVENYFPRVYDQSLFSDRSKFAEAVNHLVSSGQAKTQEDAIALLSHAQDVVRNRKYGNLELERLVNLPGYQKTPDALFNYLEGSANRISQATSFGAKDEQALKLISGIAREGGDASTAKSLYDTSVGAAKYGETSQKLSGALRKFNSTTKLGTGAITNVGQSVNTITTAGVLNTIKSLPKAFSGEGRDYALRAGVTLDGVLRDLREGGGFSGKVLGKITAPGFNSVEKFNRTLAAHAGVSYASDLATKAAKGSRSALSALEKLGLDPKAVIKQGGKLTEDQRITAARKMVERTQFKVDPQDLPGWSSSPWGKVLTQFKSFSYNQSAFLKREILDPALEGNVAPLVRFLAVGIPAGMAIQTTKNVLRNRKDEENPLKRVQQGFSQAGGFGLAGDLVTGLFPMNGKYLDPNRATTMALGTLGGPTLGTIAEGYGSLTNALQGKPQNLGRFALKQVPLVGSTLQNTILPYQAKDGSVNRRFGSPPAIADQNVPVAQAADQTDIGSLSPVEEAQLRSKLSDLKKQEKDTLNNSGLTLPLVGQIGGLTTDQKNQQILSLRQQEAALKDQLKTPTQKAKDLLDLQTAQSSLTLDRLKRVGDSAGWLATATQQIQDLTAYQQVLDPKTDKKQILSLQNKIEDLQAQVSKYKSKGGLTKPKRRAIKGVNFLKAAGVKSSRRKTVTAKPAKVPKLPKLKTVKLKNVAYKTSKPSR